MKTKDAPKSVATTKKTPDPRLRILNSLRSQAELFRQQGKNPAEVQEALDWEKKIHERIAQVEAEAQQPLPKAA